MYLPKQDDDSNPYRDYRRERHHGVLFRLCFAYIPATILFLALRMTMLSYGVPIIGFGVVDAKILELLHDLKNWYFLTFG